MPHFNKRPYMYAYECMCNVDIMPRWGVLFGYFSAWGVGSARHSSLALFDRIAWRPALIGRKRSGHSDVYQLNGPMGRVINLTLLPLPWEQWTGQWPTEWLQSQRTLSLSLFFYFTFLCHVPFCFWLHCEPFDLNFSQVKSWHSRLKNHLVCWRKHRFNNYESVCPFKKKQTFKRF